MSHDTEPTTQSVLARAILGVGVGAHIGFMGSILALQDETLGLGIVFLGMLMLIVTMIRVLPLVRAKA